jgi:hypothetical protein
MEKTAILLGCRNDGYKEDERVITCLTSMIETFDEVWFCDWNSPAENGPLLWKLRDRIPKVGKIRHFIIPENIVKILTYNDPNVSPFNGVISQNIMLRRCKADWIVCSTMDIVAPKKEYFDAFVSKVNKNTFYSISRREAEYSELENIGFDNWREFRDKLDQTSEPRYFPAKVTPNDEYSLINCCGDFQFAHRDVWNKIKGFEEQMIYACFNDTNVQKKAVLNNFNLEAHFDLPLYHLSHKNMVPQGGDLNTLHENAKKTPLLYNDAWTWVEWFTESENDNNWGLATTEIEYEIF